MFDFFRGWKRKLGVVTLGLACLFAAGWVRSFNTVEAICIEASNGFSEFGSDRGAIVFSRTVYLGEQRMPRRSGYESVRAEKLPPVYPFDLVKHGWNSQSKFEYFGFVFVTAIMGQIRGAIWRIPYWSLVMPLTLLSAYLLLSKPRGAQPTLENEEAAKV